MSKKELHLNRTRNLGDIISDAFVLVRRNFKIVGELFLLFVLPLLLLGIYNLYYVFSDLDFLNPDQSSPFAAFGSFNLLLGYGFSVLSFLLFYYIVFSAAICYRNNGNVIPTKSMINSFMAANAVKYIIYVLTIFGFMSILLLLGIGSAIVSPILTFLIFLGFFAGIIYLIPVLNILPAAYLDSDQGFVEALLETFRLVKGEWWPTFGTIFVTQIISSLASYILILPIYVIMMLQMMSSIDDPSGGAGESMGFWMSILIVVSMVASTIVLTYTASAVILKYFDLRERNDHTSLQDRIDSIGDSGFSIFENEGDL